LELQEISPGNGYGHDARGYRNMASEDIKMPYQNLYERFSTAMMANNPA